MLVWLTFLGGAAAARRCAHLRVSSSSTPCREARLAGCARHAGLAVVVILASWSGTGAQIASVQHGSAHERHGWPVGVLYWAMPVGSVLALRLFVRRNAIARREDLPLEADAARGVAS